MKFPGVLTSLSFVFLFASLTAKSQTITVSPSEVTVDSQGATSVLLTFRDLGDKRPVEATWCGALISAAPDVGAKCDPSKIFGRLPVRYNQSRRSGNNDYTDIMSVTPSVARRAYIDAAGGASSTFFYVRRFVSNSGPDQYVAVTLRLSGNGAAVPFSITNVRLLWDGGEKSVPFVKVSEQLPRITADIFYTGTARLIGRWEIVKPGESLPSPRDLLPDSSLPIEERGTQKRYTQVQRFNLFLPPGGRTLIPGPDTRLIERTVEGMHLLLLRIETAIDGLNKSNVEDASGGQSSINNGGASGFALPVLRYYVGTGGVTQVDEFNASTGPLLPLDDTQVVQGRTLVFSWPRVTGATYYRLVLEDASGVEKFSAILLRDTNFYRLPAIFMERANSQLLYWQVTAVGASGEELNETPRRKLSVVGMR